MKSIKQIALLSLLLLATPTLYAQTLSVPPLMNFQGRLSKPDGTPLPDGAHSVLFSLYSAQKFGTPVWSETDSVTSRNGAFAVLLGNVTALTDAVFAGNTWLQISIDGAAALTPRQQIVSVAHAFKADTVPDGSITDVKIAAGTITADKFATGLGAFALPYAATVNSASTLFSITNNSAGIALKGKSAWYGVNGVNGAGSGLQPLNGYGGGVWGDTDNGNGVVGTSGSFVGVFGQSSSYHGVFGRALADNQAGVYGEDFAALGTGVSGHGGANGVFGVNTSNLSGLPSKGGYAGVYGQGKTGVQGYSTGSPGYGVIGEANGSLTSGVLGSSTNGTGVEAFSTNGTGISASGGTYAGYFSGKVYVDGNAPFATAAVQVYEGVKSGVGIFAGDLAPQGYSLFESNSSGPTTHAFFAENGVGVFSVADGGATTINSTLTVNGGITGHFLNLIGGSDVAEPYEIAPDGGVKPLPGMVVVMDEAHDGQMKVATQAYASTVGGIISGAGGVNPGITLTQKGTIADGSMPVASVGRVWCWCDADANGPIKPGSLLTTSNTPGYAMRVTDYNRANGATIGKAMSSLKSGKGLVLVLVSLK